MAESDFQEKTEKATPKKRADARKKGRVAKSREINSLGVLLGGLATLCLFGSYMYHHITLVMRKSFAMVQNPVLDLSKMDILCERAVIDYLWIVLPVMSAVFVIAVLSNIVQVGFVLSWESLKPKMDKFNIVKGMGRLVSKQSLMELFKSTAKLVIVGGIAYWTVKGEYDALKALGGIEVGGIGLYILKVILKLFLRVCLAMIFLAAIDFGFQKWQFEQQLKMTKQEIKEEFKQTEGDPMVKSRIKKIQMEVARRRMMQKVPEADVVVTNPVHLAVAIQYDRAAMNAPHVVAKGAEQVAEKIKAVAREHNVPVVENKNLAQNLYRIVDVGGEIPMDLYQMVAEVLAYVYKMKGKLSKEQGNNR
jgi:flagellar biosynthesis protein FlhB